MEMADIRSEIRSAFMRSGGTAAHDAGHMILTVPGIGRLAVRYTEDGKTAHGWRYDGPGEEGEYVEGLSLGETHPDPDWGVNPWPEYTSQARIPVFRSIEMYWSPWVQSPSVAEDMARQDRDVLAAAARDPSWVRYHITAMDRAGRALVRLGFAPV